MTEADAAAGGHGGSRASKRHKQDTTAVPPLTKRQRRKHVNPSNTWPQQPKIQSPAARARANLRVAGLLPGNSSSSSSSSNKVVPTVDPTLVLDSPEVRFGRFLASPEQRKRHASIAQLESYLKQRCDIHNAAGISEMDLLKLWKGMWHTLYLADKVPVQEELSKRLAKLVWCLAGTEEEDEYAAQMYLDMCNQQEEDFVMQEVVNTLDEEEEDEENEDHASNDSDETKEERSSDEQEADDGDEQDEEEEEQDDEQRFQDEAQQEIPDEFIQHCRGAHLAALFVKTFFRTIQREWGKMDKHRIDKFYTLVRLMYREIFSYMATRHWNRGIVFLFNDIIRDEVLLQLPNGLRFHLIDIAVSELAKVNTKAPMSLTEATILDCLDPYFALAQNADDSMVHGRVMENIFGKFLNEYSIVSEREVEKELVMDQVHVGTIAKFLFELGSDGDTQERYRKPLYDMHKTYMKQLKRVGKDVELDVGSEEEMEDVIGVEATEEENVNVQETGHAEGLKRKTTEPKSEEGGEGVERAIEAQQALNGSSEDCKPSHKKKRKKDMQEPESHGNKVMSSIEGPVADSEAHCSKSKRAKKKKKNKKRKSSVSGDEGSKDEEEVITISYSEQKMAAEAISGKDGKDAKNRKESSNVSREVSNAISNEMTSDEKRVKFGRANHSKSYKASMKALETVKHTPKTPEHGILRSKITDQPLKSSNRKSSKKKKKSKKKAANGV